MSYYTNEGNYTWTSDINADGVEYTMICQLEAVLVNLLQHDEYVKNGAYCYWSWDDIHSYCDKHGVTNGIQRTR